MKRYCSLLNNPLSDKVNATECSSQRFVDTFYFCSQPFLFCIHDHGQMEALVRRKWTRVRFDGFLPELLWSHVAEAAHGPLLVEEADVSRDGFGDVVGIADAEIDQHLDLGPAVYRLHRAVVRRRTYTGHRPHDIIGKKRFVERLRRVHRALIRVENGSQFGVLFLQFDERAQGLEIRPRVAFFGR